MVAFFALRDPIKHSSPRVHAIPTLAGPRLLRQGMWSGWSLRDGQGALRVKPCSKQCPVIVSHFRFTSMITSRVLCTTSSKYGNNQTPMCSNGECCMWWRNWLLCSQSSMCDSCWSVERNSLQNVFLASCSQGPKCTYVSLSACVGGGGWNPLLVWHAVSQPHLAHTELCPHYPSATRGTTLAHLSLCKVTRPPSFLNVACQRHTCVCLGPGSCHGAMVSTLDLQSRGAWIIF